MKSPRVEAARERIFTVDELEAILQESHGSRWEAAFWIPAVTGMRVSELLGLEWKNIDLTTGVLRIEQQTGRVYGEPGVRLLPLKTAASRRVVAVPPAVCRILRWHSDVQRLERKRAEGIGDWEQSNTVFCGPTGKLYFRSQLMTEFRRVERMFAGMRLASPGAALTDESDPWNTGGGHAGGQTVVGTA